MLQHPTTKQTRTRIFFFVFLFASFCVIGSSFFVPKIAQAKMPWDFSEPIIPCGITKEQPCTPCDLAKLARNIVEFLLTIAGSIAILNFILAGLTYTVAPATSGASTKSGVGNAKKILTYTVGGFLIILLSWVIVNTVTTVLGYSKNWFTLDCASLNSIGEEEIITPSPPGGGCGNNGTSGGGSGSGGCPIQSYYCNDKNICVPAPSGLGTPVTTYTSNTCNGVCPSVIPSTCDDLQALAKQNNVPYPAQNSKTINDLTSCLSQNLGSEISGIKTDTFGVDHPVCNYTRGAKETCSTPPCKSLCSPDGTCDHAPNSCHYGGATGTDGALAIDYEVTGKVAKDIVDTARSACKQYINNPDITTIPAPGQGAWNGARCEQTKNGKVYWVECGSGKESHVHISGAGCSNN